MEVKTSRNFSENCEQVELTIIYNINFKIKGGNSYIAAVDLLKLFFSHPIQINSHKTSLSSSLGTFLGNFDL